MLACNGWHLQAHPLIEAQLQRLGQAVRRTSAQDPFNRGDSADLRLLASLRVVMLEQIPANPFREEYRPHLTPLLPGSRWLCARLGGGRFGVYFRVDQERRRIIFGWIADRTAFKPPVINAEPYILFGVACTVSAKGKIALPQPVREVLQMTAGGRLTFWLQGSTIVAGATRGVWPARTDITESSREPALAVPRARSMPVAVFHA
jgi:hypothetical protein